MADLLNILAVGLLLGGTYALVSVGLNLIFGVIRVVNFAQGEFVMLGMYGTFAAYSTLAIDPYLAVVLVVPALFVLGAAVQRVLLAPGESASEVLGYGSDGDPGPGQASCGPEEEYFEVTLPGTALADTTTRSPVRTSSCTVPSARSTTASRVLGAARGRPVACSGSSDHRNRASDGA